MDKLLELEAAALLEQPNTAGEWFALIDKIKKSSYTEPTEHIVHVMTMEEACAEALKMWEDAMDGK